VSTYSTITARLLCGEIGHKGTTNFAHMQIKKDFFSQKLSKIKETFF
jgi:hypothetical protein